MAQFEGECEAWSKYASAYIASGNNTAEDYPPDNGQVVLTTAAAAFADIMLAEREKRFDSYGVRKKSVDTNRNRTGPPGFVSEYTPFGLRDDL